MSVLGTFSMHVLGQGHALLKMRVPSLFPVSYLPKQNQRKWTGGGKEGGHITDGAGQARPAGV